MYDLFEQLTSSTTNSSTIATICATGIVTVAVLFKVGSKSLSFQRDVHSSFQSVLSGITSLLQNKDSVLSRDGVKDTMNEYDNFFMGARTNVGSLHKVESITYREQQYKTMIDHFYNLVTDFYEWGWGQSFHFAPRQKGETFHESILRSEYYLALRTGMNSTTKAIDIGCGVGGPMRNIHQFTNADITGVTINEYQVKVGNQYCQQKNMNHKCRIVQGDFQRLDQVFQPATYDVAFAVEATCHSPNRVECFRGVHKALKSGGLFVGYEWVVLPNRGYDSTNKDHIRIKEGIEVGNSLPTLAVDKDIIKALEDSGFEVLDSFDANQNVHSPLETPWYEPLDGKFTTASGFRMTSIGRACTHILVTLLETIGIAPKGTTRVSALLNATAKDLVEGGKLEIFTPSFFFLARKK